VFFEIAYEGNAYEIAYEGKKLLMKEIRKKIAYEGNSKLLMKETITFFYRTTPTFPLFLPRFLHMISFS